MSPATNQDTAAPSDFVVIFYMRSFFYLVYNTVFISIDIREHARWMRLAARGKCYHLHTEVF